MATQIQFRRGTETQWFNGNPILAQGEIGVELDTSRFKIGNGIDNWNDLPYATGIQGEKGDTGDTGAPGVDGDGTAFYGVIGTQTPQEVTISTSGTYVDVDITGTFETDLAYGLVASTSVDFGIKNDTGATQLLVVIGSADVSIANNKTAGLRLAVNGVSLPETTCQATTGTAGFAKLMSHWLIELEDGDEVSLAGANITDTTNITFERAKIVAFTPGRQGIQGEPGEQGIQGEPGEIPDDSNYAKLDTANTFTSNQVVNNDTPGSPALLLKAEATQTANVLEVKDSSNTNRLTVNKDGYTTTNNLQTDGGIRVGSAPTYSTNQRWVSIGNASSVPSTVSNGAILYVEDGVAKIRQPDNTIVVLQNPPANIQDLLNVDTAGVEDGYVLTFDNDTSTWIAAPATGGGGGGATQLNDLTDVDIDFLESGDILIYDDFLGKWINGAPQTGGDLPQPSFIEAPIVDFENNIFNIENNANLKTVIDIGLQFYSIFFFESSHPIRFRVYTTLAGRDADENRSILTPAPENVGCVLDVITTAELLSLDILPQASGWIRNSTDIYDLPVTVTNLSGSTASITVNIGYIQTAADIFEEESGIES
jgi:hypothetical protein